MAKLQEDFKKYADIDVMDQNNQLRSTFDILTDLANVWDTLGPNEQQFLSIAASGARQNKVLQSLMANWEGVEKAMDSSVTATGSAMRENEKYLNSIEGKTNQLASAMQSLAIDTINGQLIKSLVDLSTWLVKTTEDIGLFNVLMVAAIGFTGSKLTFTIAGLSDAFAKLATSLKLSTAAAATFTSVMTALTGAVVVVGIIYALNELNVTMTETYTTFTKMKDEMQSSVDSLGALAKEYEALASKEKKSEEDKKRLKDIQAVLNTQYGALKDGVNVYSDAIDGNSDAIKKNIDWINAKAEAEKRAFIASGQKQLEESKAFLASGQSLIKAPWYIGMLPEEKVSAEARLAVLDDQIAKGWDIFGLLKMSRDTLEEEIALAEDLAYQMAVTKASLIPESSYSILQGILEDIPVVAAEAAEAVYQTFDQLKSSIEEGTFSLDELKNSVESGTVSLEQLNEIASELDSTFLSNQGMLQSVKDTYEEFGQITLEQAANMIQAGYAEALVIDQTTGKITVKIETLHNLVVAQAQTAYQSAVFNTQQAIEAGAVETVITALKRKELALKGVFDTISSMPVTSFPIAPNLGFSTPKTDTAAKKAASDAEKAAKEQEKAYQDLVKATIDMIKQKKEAEKDALKDQLDGYKKIIEARKDILDQQKAEREFNKKTTNLNQEIGDIQSEIMELQFDDSEEANKRRLELQEQLVEKQTNLEDEQYDHSVDKQKDALDAEYDRFSETIDNKIRAIEDYLDKSGQMTQDAIAMIESRSDAFYESLLAWNRIYGTGIDSDITGAWDRAFNAVQNYTQEAISGAGAVADAQISNLQKFVNAYQQTMRATSGALGSLGSQNQGSFFGFDTSGLAWPEYHSGGMVTGGDKNSEVFAKLMEGEVVTTPSQMNNFIKNTMPSIASVASNIGGAITIEMPINVAGSLDKTVLPDIKKMVFESINSAMRTKGYVRNVNAYSV